MPRQLEAKKDVAACEKRRGVGNKRWSDDVWMGEPNLSNQIIIKWIHSLMKRTRGSETSQYPEEKKSTEIPLVVASERGPAQWLYCNNWKHLESCTKVGDSPVQVKSNAVLE